MYNPRIVELYDEVNSFERYPFDTPLKILNIKDYGAMCDGITDDTAALQKALDDVAENGIIFIPQGVTIFSQVTLNSNKAVTLKGVGTFLNRSALPGDSAWHNLDDIKGSTLKSTATSGIAIDATLGRIHLQDLGIVGANGLTTGVHCGIVSNPYRILLRWSNVQFANFAIGASIDNIYYGLYQAVNSRGCTKGFYLKGANASTLVVCSGTTGDFGLHLDGSANVVVIGGAWEGFLNTALLVDDSEECTLQNIYFENVNADYAIDTSGVSDRLLVQNCHCGTAGDNIRIGSNHSYIFLGKYGNQGSNSNLTLAGSYNTAYVSFNHAVVANTGNFNRIHRLGPSKGEYLLGTSLVFDGNDPVLKSPNGTLYAIRVADNGTLSTTAV